MRAAASAWVVHVTLVPALFTSGSAKQLRVAPQLCVTYWPPTHCAKSAPTHASVPSLQVEFALRLANWAFCCCACWPFESWKLLPEDDVGAEAEDDAAATATSVFAAGAAGRAAEVDATAEDDAPAPAPDDDDEEPSPVTPPVAPVLAMRLAASDWVVQVMEVPALLTSGSAKQLRLEPQLCMTYEPLTHCANWPPMHASLPSSQVVFAVSEANWAFCC